MSDRLDLLTPFRPSGIVTLTTDFGHRDPFVGVMKGQVLRRWRSATLVDLTHEVQAHRPVEAGFWLGHAFQYFPPGTVHVAVVDPGVGSSRAIAVVAAAGHVFLAPDNGLLAGVVERVPPGSAELRLLDETVLPRLGIGSPSATFHGRDIFAPLAAELAAGRMSPAGVGPVVAALAPGPLGLPERSEGELRGVVVTVDHFGNLLTNIDGAAVQALAAVQVHVGSLRLAVRRTYADVPAGGYLALVNSFGMLEIARAEGDAAAGLGLGRGTPVVVLGTAK